MLRTASAESAWARPPTPALRPTPMLGQQRRRPPRRAAACLLKRICLKPSLLCRARAYQVRWTRPGRLVVKHRHRCCGALCAQASRHGARRNIWSRTLPGATLATSSPNMRAVCSVRLTEAPARRAAPCELWLAGRARGASRRSPRVHLWLETGCRLPGQDARVLPLRIPCRPRCQQKRMRTFWRGCGTCRLLQYFTCQWINVSGMPLYWQTCSIASLRVTQTHVSWKKHGRGSCWAQFPVEPTCVWSSRGVYGFGRTANSWSCWCGQKSIAATVPGAEPHCEQPPCMGPELAGHAP